MKALIPVLLSLTVVAAIPANGAIEVSTHQNKSFQTDNLTDALKARGLKSADQSGLYALLENLRHALVVECDALQDRLHRHAAAQRRVVSLVHHAHRPLAEDAAQFVTA
jgi:hypothetical protein